MVRRVLCLSGCHLDCGWSNWSVGGERGGFEEGESVERVRRSRGDSSRHCWRRRVERAYDQGEGGWEIEGGEVEGSDC